MFSFGLWCVLRASLRALASAISISWLGRRQHSGQASAMSADGRLNRARTVTFRSLVFHGLAILQGNMSCASVYSSNDIGHIATVNCTSQQAEERIFWLLLKMIWCWDFYELVCVLLSMIPVIPWYIYFSYNNAEFVGNKRCCQALDWSA